MTAPSSALMLLARRDDAAFDAPVFQPAVATAEQVVIAQADADVLGDISGAFSNFVESGQVWALIIGIVVGYMLRGMTTYR